jgi:GTPase
VLITDTVGFIQKLPTQLVAAFRATLEEITEADLLLHVLDITHANAQEHAQTVEQTLKDLKAEGKPVLTVLNKIDRMEGVSEGDVAGMAEALGLPSDHIAVSAQRGWGIEALRLRIEESLAQSMVALDAFIPYNRNDLVSLWHRRGVIEQEEYVNEGTHIQGRVPRTLVTAFHAFASARR